MIRSRDGFTVVELVISLLIGAILTSIAITSIRGPQGRLAVRTAKHMYATMHQRARSRAIEQGETVLLVVDVVGDSAFTFAPGSGIDDHVRFDQETEVDLRSNVNSFLMCMTPRGYADYSCGSYGGFITATSASAIRLEFWHANVDSSSVVILPMGQLVGM